MRIHGSLFGGIKRSEKITDEVFVIHVPTHIGATFVRNLQIADGSQCKQKNGSWERSFEDGSVLLFPVPRSAFAIIVGPFLGQFRQRGM